jgi:hypothetical protein
MRGAAEQPVAADRFEQVCYYRRCARRLNQGVMPLLNSKMVESPEQLSEIIDSELERIRIPEMKEFLRHRLISPVLHYRRWDYSREPVSYPCWLVADLRHKDIGIVYSEYGHGKHDPWGVVHVSGEWFGMDDRWFLTLEDAFINSGCWNGPVPNDYEVS